MNILNVVQCLSSFFMCLFFILLIRPVFDLYLLRGIMKKEIEGFRKLKTQFLKEQFEIKRELGNTIEIMKNDIEKLKS